MAHFMPPHLAPSAPHLAAFFEHQMKVKAEIAAAAEAAAKASKSQNESDDGGDDDDRYDVHEDPGGDGPASQGLSVVERMADRRVPQQTLVRKR